METFTIIILLLLVFAGAYEMGKYSKPSKRVKPMVEKEISMGSYLDQFVESVKKGEGSVGDIIKVEKLVAERIDINGKAVFWVVDVGGKYQKENLTRMTFDYYPKKKLIQPLNQFRIGGIREEDSSK